MTQSMVNTVIERVNEMKSNVEIQKIMMQFSSNEEAYNWLVKAAIATLMGVQNEKNRGGKRKGSGRKPAPYNRR